MRLDSAFYQRDVVTVAKDLLGKILVRIINGEKLSCIIVETEAYKGPEDKGCHAYGNRRTKRTQSLYLPGGFTYVYFIYGMHYMLNIVSAGLNEPQGTLIRAGEPVTGLETMSANRGLAQNNSHHLLNGPGKLCKALAVDLSFNGYNLISGPDLYIEDAIADDAKNGEVVAAKRINIDYAEEYQHKLWRFYLKGNPCVSRL